jgi:dihydropyrimidinase
MAPPLRKTEDVEALWEAIENNDVDVIATDHCPFYIKEKLNGKHDFRLAPGGTPGVEERIEIILTEGIKRGVSINILIDKLATKPAKIFGLYPKKGTIQVGMDADLIVVNNKKETIKFENRHNANDYSVYEGLEVNYVVETTIQRGNVLVHNDKLLANKGDGIFLRRNANN